ncbi:MAG: hypothetical protein GF334_11135 [Candidatus Altiarchaeales archaeon]|nr:hypothetical protein [Candidatus Altiarchaeales archaeon]
MYGIEIQILGYQRSGLHAVANWIMGLYDTAVYKNDAGVNVYEGIYSPVLYENGVQVGTYSEYPKAQAVLIGHESGSVKGIKNYLSHEAYLSSKRTCASRHGAAQFAEDTVLVYNVRDPFNSLASAWKFFRKKDKVLNFSSLWLEYAREYVGETDHLKDLPHMFVLFNKWRSSKEYRRKLARQLGRPFNDRNLNKMLGYGSGSSFSGTTHQKDASKLDVENRWKTFEDDPFYKSIFEKQPEIVRLSKRVFDFVPPPFEHLL